MFLFPLKGLGRSLKTLGSIFPSILRFSHFTPVHSGLVTRYQISLEMGLKFKFLLIKVITTLNITNNPFC